MTGEKVKEVLQFYFDYFGGHLHGMPVRQLSPEATLHSALYIGDFQQTEHLKFMCLEAKKFVDEGRVEKAMRWLGFLQGCLWKQGLFTLDELKNHSRPDNKA